MRPREHGYGVLLTLIVASLIFQLATSEGDVTHLVTILLLGGTLLAALWTSQARAGRLWVASGVVVVVTVGAAIIFAASGAIDDTQARIVSLILVALTPAAIFHGLLRHFRDERRVTLQTMFGVLCIYLVLGSIFEFIYGILDTTGSAPFFAQIESGNTSDYLYFSFSTLTTTGYGDLTAGTDLGRAFAITEQLLGQIYLVTVVAVIIGSLSRAASGRRS